MSKAQGLESLGSLDIGYSIVDRTLTEKELMRLSGNSQMAENALLTVHHGIAAIGSMLAGIGLRSDCGDGLVQHAKLTREA